jgi:plasmid stabilization system protein ParE
LKKQPYLSRSAETDLIEIWVYVAEDSVEAADRLIAKIRRQCQVLADTATSGGSSDAELESQVASTWRHFSCGELT